MDQRLDILYSFRRCPYAMRARLALQLRGVPMEWREILLRDKPEELVAISPKSTVPVVYTSAGEVLDESLDIMRWALQQSDPMNWLEAGDRSPDAMLALIAGCDGDFKRELDGYKYKAEPLEREAHRARASHFLRELEVRLRTSPWLFGDSCVLADAAIAPFVRQFANTDREWFDAQPWQALRLWLDDFLASPLFASIMHKRPPWQPGDPVTHFPVLAETRWLRSRA